MTGRPAGPRKIILPEKHFNRLINLLVDSFGSKYPCLRIYPGLKVSKSARPTFLICIYPEPGTAQDVDTILAQFSEEINAK